MDDDLPPGMTPEMWEGLHRGEDVRYPDGTPVPRVWAHAEGPSGGAWTPVEGDADELRGRLEELLEGLRNGPSSVVLSPDYGVEIPLWPQWDSTMKLVPGDLLTKLILWQQDFDSHFRHDTGCKPKKQRIGGQIRRRSSKTICAKRSWVGPR